MAEPTLPETFVRYLQDRQQEQLDARDTALAAMTPDERQLLHDAAVMGFVHGNIHGSAHPYDSNAFPRDAWIVATVLDACGGDVPRYHFLTPLMKTGKRPEPDWADLREAARKAGWTPDGRLSWWTWTRRDDRGLDLSTGWALVQWTARSISLVGPGAGSRAERSAVDLIDPTPAQVLAAARLVGIGGDRG